MIRSTEFFIFSIPFTIQRLTEMLNNPRMHYKRADKFMNGLEKVKDVKTDEY